MKIRRLALVALAALPLSVGACATPVDLKQALQITESSSGWYDAGVVDGKNKLVPSVIFRLRKSGGAEIDSVSVNALFRAADGAESSLDNDSFVQNVKFEADNQTAPVVIRSDNGYTADPPQSRADMLKHSQFRDMRVQIFVKHGASQWTEVGRVDVPRKLLTQ
jgi:hypothetical protein